MGWSCSSKKEKGWDRVIEGSRFKSQHGQKKKKLPFFIKKILTIIFIWMQGWRLVSPKFSFLLESAIFPTLGMNEKVRFLISIGVTWKFCGLIFSLPKCGSSITSTRFHLINAQMFVSINTMVSVAA